MSIPTLLFYKDGEQKERVTGVLDKAALAEKLGSIL
jgi:thiol:disulfide interchange protein